MRWGSGGPMRPELSRRSWRKVRVAVRKRDRHTCQGCGAVQSPFARRAFPVGHRVPPERYAGHHDDPRNLVTLCWRCNASQGGMDFDTWKARPYGRPAAIRDNKAAGQPNVPAGGTFIPVTGDYSRRTIFDREPA